nr:PI-type proteinase [Rhodococcus qingshengii]
MSEQNSTDRTDQTDEPQTTGTGTDHGPGTGSDTAPKDVQTDPSGERTWADEGGASSTGPATDTD